MFREELADELSWSVLMFWACRGDESIEVSGKSGLVVRGMREKILAPIGWMNSVRREC